MEIKAYQADFLEDLALIYLDSRRDAFYWTDPGSYHLSDFKEDTQGERIWVALEEGKVLGFIAVWQADHFIHHLYVDKAHYRKGIGQCLIEEVYRFYQAPLRLKCLSKNKRAISFYQSQGFKVLDKGVDNLGEYCLLQLKSLNHTNA